MTACVSSHLSKRHLHLLPLHKIVWTSSDAWMEAMAAPTPGLEPSSEVQHVCERSVFFQRPWIEL